MKNHSFLTMGPGTRHAASNRTSPAGLAYVVVMLCGILLGALSHPAGAAQSDWEWQNRLPQGNHLNGIWGTGSTDVFAVGDAGTILHYDGWNWTPMDSGTTESLRGVWGSGPIDVFVVGGTDYPASSVILHYNGTVWTTMTNLASEQLNGVWGSAGDDVFAVGEYGTVLHYDGLSWTQMNTVPGPDLHGVWGTAWNDVYAVGHYGAVPPKGVILHYDGTTWLQVFSLSDCVLRAVGGVPQHEVFAVGSDSGWEAGSDGNVLRGDGSGWTLTKVGEYQALLGIWGNTWRDVFVVGGQGAIFHFDGSTLAPMKSETTADLKGVWASGPNDAFAVGLNGTIVHYDGITWSEMSHGVQEDLVSVWGCGATDVYAVTAWNSSSPGPGAILHYDGKVWSELDIHADINVKAIWGNAWNDVFAVGNHSKILRYDGSDWRLMAHALPSSGSLVGVWGSGPGDVFAVDFYGRIVHYDGATWSVVLDGIKWSFSGIWGTGPDDVFACGGELHKHTPHILHYDGVDWTEMDIGITFGEISGVWGTGPCDVFAVGTCGLILHYDGASWASMDSGTTEKLLGVCGSGPNEVFAVGGETIIRPRGVILRYDGTSWEPMTSGTAHALNGVWVSGGAREVFAVGSGGTILHYGPTHLYTIRLPDLLVDPGDLLVRPPPVLWEGVQGHVDIEFTQPVNQPGQQPPAGFPALLFNQATLTASSDSGHAFSYWEGDLPEGHERDNPLTLLLNRDLDLTPVFVEEQADPGGGLEDSGPDQFGEICGVGTGAMIPFMLIALWTSKIGAVPHRGHGRRGRPRRGERHKDALQSPAGGADGVPLLLSSARVQANGLSIRMAASGQPSQNRALDHCQSSGVRRAPAGRGLAWM
ncbi:MAG: hypothetical protein JXQ75_04100 [Phycisphaerae bacterium]|nr:hypothetical protein [Phycisphaerae bacterium]